MARFSRFISLGICSANFTRGFITKVRQLTTKYERSSKAVKISPILFASQTMTVMNIEDDKDMLTEEKTDNPPTILNSVQTACNNSLNSTIDFLNAIFEAISDSAFQYKEALNELYLCLEKYEASKEFTAALEEFEDAIIGARAKAHDCEIKYMELITVMQSVEHVTKAIGELSFLMREEALALILTNKLNSMRESIELDSNDIKYLKRKFYRFEDSLFSGSEINEHTAQTNADERNIMQ